MSKRNSAHAHLEWMLRIGAINGWVDIDFNRLEVTTSDDKTHTWAVREVLAFYAGFCAGRSYSYKIQESGCPYPSSQSPAEAAAGSSRPTFGPLIPRRST